jgi:hypothetical protein
MRALTQTDYSNVFNTGVATFAELCEEEMQAEIFAIKRPKVTAKAKRMWLYVYALNTWDNTDGAFNYLTEAQMLGLISKIQNHGL